MKLIHAALAIADISGYTGFIRRREVSLLHAEQIVSDLIEALVSGAERPLILNKLEGDAALQQFLLLLGSGAMGAQLAVLGLTLGIFFGTLSLRRPVVGRAAPGQPSA